MQPDRLADLIANRENRIQRGHRLLKDHGDLVAANLTHLLVVEFEEIAPLIENFATDDAFGRRGYEAHDGKRSHALAAARLSYEAERLAFTDLEAHAVDGAHLALRGEKRRP